MKITLTSYGALMVSCTKVSTNGGAIQTGEAFTGFARFKPSVYTRFAVNLFSSNIVAKILEEGESGGKFLTYSGSIYSWEIISNDDSLSFDEVEVEVPERIVTLVNDFVSKYDNMNKLINKI